MLSDPQLHYLDNAATSRVDPAVAQAVSEALTELWANPSSLYDPAVSAQDAIAAARARVAKTLHCRSDEIYFTACGSEGNNMAVTGAARPRKHWGNKIVVTGFEHPSVQRPIRALKDEGFTVVEVMPGADGRIDTQKFLAEIDKNTVLAACMAVNNETGAVQDIAALGKGIKARNSRTHFHVDAVQAAGQIPIRMRDWDVDALSVSGHKFGTPKGLGALLVRGRTPIEPVLSGGGQERGLRSGTQNVAGAVALAIGLNESNARMAAQYRELTDSRDMLIDAVRRVVPRAELTGDPVSRLPGHASFIFPGVTGEALLVDLGARGIAASSGSACAIGRHEIPGTLLAMGLKPQIARSALRMTFRRPLTREEIERISMALEDSYTELTH